MNGNTDWDRCTEGYTDFFYLSKDAIFLLFSDECPCTFSIPNSCHQWPFFLSLLFLYPVTSHFSFFFSPFHVHACFCFWFFSVSPYHAISCTVSCLQLPRWPYVFYWLLFQLFPPYFFFLLPAASPPFSFIILVFSTILTIKEKMECQCYLNIRMCFCFLPQRSLLHAYVFCFL